MRLSVSDFEILYKECFPGAMRLAMSLLRDQDEARDVVHEVFVRIYESSAEVGNRAAFVMRSVRNACLNRMNQLDTREKIRRKMMLEPPPEDEEPERDPQEVADVISKVLTPREQQVVEKIYSEGMSYKETSEALGVSVSAVNKNLVASLKKLRAYFKTSLNNHKHSSFRGSTDPWEENNEQLS